MVEVLYILNKHFKKSNLVLSHETFTFVKAYSNITFLCRIVVIQALNNLKSIFYSISYIRIHSLTTTAEYTRMYFEIWGSFIF